MLYERGYFCLGIGFAFFVIVLKVGDGFGDVACVIGKCRYLRGNGGNCRRARQIRISSGEGYRFHVGKPFFYLAEKCL